MSSVSFSSSSTTLPATLLLDRRPEMSRDIPSRLAILGLLMFRLRYAVTRLPRDEFDIVLVKFSMLMVRRGRRRAAVRDGELLEGPLTPPSPAAAPAEGEAVDDSCGLLLSVGVPVLCSSLRTPSIMHGVSLLMITNVYW